MDIESMKSQAGFYLDNNYTCSQSVFKVFKDNYKELECFDEAMFAGFGGGFACKGKVCGTIVAATALISHFKLNRDEPKNRKELYEILRNFYKDIEEKYGDMSCYEIVKINFLKPEESARYSTEKHEQVCKPLVKYVTEQVCKIIENN